MSTTLGLATLDPFDNFNCGFGLGALDKYYGHQNHCICFANKECQAGNADALVKGWEGLVNNYTTEEIKVEFILDCFHAILALSILGNTYLN